MTDVPVVLETIRDRIKKHGTNSFNEENTAVVLVEPVLDTLGWDLTDLQSVDRQYRVYDGTKLDYALKIDGKPSLFVEVKGVGHTLDDPKFVAQTVNYANNEGVLWCVLTNGLIYRVYKTNEPVPMGDKLMLEIDVRNIEDGPSRAATVAALALISRKSLLDGRLATTAELVFTGGAVRTALESLLAKPTPAFRNAVEKAVGQPIEKERLDRVMAHFMVHQKTALQAAAPRYTEKPTPTVTVSTATYSRGHHASAKPKAIVELFDQLDERVSGLGKVLVTYTKTYVNYSTAKKSFMTAELFRDKLKLYFSIPWADSPKPIPGAMRDVSNIGHYGMGDTEFVLSSLDQLDDVLILAAVSFDRNSPKTGS